jgi:hypothetical protein
MATNAEQRRCAATNRRGERCAVKVVNAADYCVAHDPDRRWAIGSREVVQCAKQNPYAQA